MMQLKSNKTSSMVCLIISALINAIANISILWTRFEDMEYVNPFETAFFIAFGLWQIANIAISIYCAIEQQSASQFQAYLKVNEYIIGWLSSVLFVLDIVFWIMFHCEGDYCPLLDFAFLIAIVIILAVGLTGFLMVRMAYMMCENDQVEFKMVSHNEQKPQYKI